MYRLKTLKYQLHGGIIYSFTNCFLIVDLDADKAFLICVYPVVYSFNSFRRFKKNTVSKK